MSHPVITVDFSTFLSDLVDAQQRLPPGTAPAATASPHRSDTFSLSNSRGGRESAILQKYDFVQTSS